MRFRVLYQDEHFVAIDKPAGFHVHPPEDPNHRIPTERNCLRLLRKQLGDYLYPVHRLDGATSGVLLFALNAPAAEGLQIQFRAREMEKTYFAVVRGWVPESGRIDHPLPEQSLTEYETLARVELPGPLGRYATARYSLVRVEPRSGRMHQIRRHFAHIRHPLIGDAIYGDGKQNRFFRERTQASGLLLRAYSLRLRHPGSGRAMEIQARWREPWHRIFDLFGVCPIP